MNMSDKLRSREHFRIYSTMKLFQITGKPLVLLTKVTRLSRATQVQHEIGCLDIEDGLRLKISD